MSKTRDYAVKGFIIGAILTWILRGVLRFAGRHWKGVLLSCLVIWLWYQISPEKQRNLIRNEVVKDQSLVTVHLIGMHKSEDWGKVDTVTFEIQNGAQASIRNIGMRCDYEEKINLDYIDPDEPEASLKTIRGRHRVNIMVQPGETKRIDMAFDGTVIEGMKGSFRDCKADFDWDDASVLREHPELDFRTQAELTGLAASYRTQQACFSCTIYYDVTVTGTLVNNSKTYMANGGRFSCQVLDEGGNEHRLAGFPETKVAPGKSGLFQVKFKKLQGYLFGIRSITCLPEAVYQGDAERAN
jgi:hypothetical protein